MSSFPSERIGRLRQLDLILQTNRNMISRGDDKSANERLWNSFVRNIILTQPPTNECVCRSTYGAIRPPDKTFEFLDRVLVAE